VAIVTGAGSGIGRELASQLVAKGCNVALCDLDAESLAATSKLLLAQNPLSVRVTTFVGDASSAADMKSFAEDVRSAHSTDHIDLLFNNAGVGGGASFVMDDEQEWEKTFNTTWGAVYRPTRAFLPMLIASKSALIINMCSVNALFALNGPRAPVTAYGSAKSAVKGFTEGLIHDLAVYAPQIGVVLVIPGHVSTSIAANSNRFHGRDPRRLSVEQLRAERVRLGRLGDDVTALTYNGVRSYLEESAKEFQRAPVSAAEAARSILDGVHAGHWRILIGRDAEFVDWLMRNFPVAAYWLSWSRIAMLMRLWRPYNAITRKVVGLRARFR
jgi:NAD(P)-dependent dehydrogenase (short-subunit alcohol dehydrogenase family)